MNEKIQSGMQTYGADSSDCDGFATCSTTPTKAEHSSYKGHNQIADVTTDK